jgi:endoplasmic reticulum-Golgi intermediate compartment protein 3
MGRMVGLSTNIGAARVDSRQRTRYIHIFYLNLTYAESMTGEKMEIHLNITFPRVPCELLTLDVMDVSGEQQTGVVHGISKVRLSPVLEGSIPIERTSLALHAQDDTAKHMDPDYCGSCYSAPAPADAQKAGCCNTCDEVRDAYASNSWAFGKGEHVEQCEREGYGEKLEGQRKEGCRIEGGLRVNKVVGNFHIAPGRSFSNMNMHVHDLNNYFDTPVEGGHTFSHQIHELHFGPQLPAEVVGKWSDHHHDNPLDATAQQTDEAAFNFMYFVKVVSTSFIPLGWDVKSSAEIHAAYQDMVPLGTHGYSGHGTIETHQYSVTSHKRSLRGGNDAAEGHKERVHAHDGIPGVFFSYDISPMKVINREARPKTFAGFLTGICAVIGGTLTVAAAIDRGVYEGSTRLKKLHQR